MDVFVVAIQCIAAVSRALEHAPFVLRGAPIKRRYSSPRAQIYHSCRGAHKSRTIGLSIMHPPEVVNVLDPVQHT